MTSSSTTTSSLKRRAAVSRSSTSRTANIVAIAATVSVGSCNVGTVWTFICPMSLLSTVVTDVVRSVTLLFPLEMLDEGIELCVGEGARRGLRILQVACWTPSLVTKCLSISVLSEATDVSKGELTSDRIPSTTPGAEPPRDARDSGSARSHSTHLETSSSDRPKWSPTRRSTRYQDQISVK